MGQKKKLIGIMCTSGMQGPQGPKGDKGDTGPQGPQGEKGDPGSTVTVSATGTSTNEVNYITIDGVESKLAGGRKRTEVEGTALKYNELSYVENNNLYLCHVIPLSGSHALVV